MSPALVATNRQLIDMSGALHEVRAMLQKASRQLHEMSGARHEKGDADVPPRPSQSVAAGLRREGRTPDRRVLLPCISVRA